MQDSVNLLNNWRIPKPALAIGLRKRLVRLYFGTDSAMNQRSVGALLVITSVASRFGSSPAYCRDDVVR